MDITAAQFGGDCTKTGVFSNIINLAAQLWVEREQVVPKKLDAQRQVRGSEWARLR